MVDVGPLPLRYSLEGIGRVAVQSPCCGKPLSP